MNTFLFFVCDFFLGRLLFGFFVNVCLRRLFFGFCWLGFFFLFQEPLMDFRGHLVAEEQYFREGNVVKYDNLLVPSSYNSPETTIHSHALYSVSPACTPQYPAEMETWPWPRMQIPGPSTGPAHLPIPACGDDPTSPPATSRP